MKKILIKISWIVVLLPILIAVPLWNLNNQGYFKLKNIQMNLMSSGSSASYMDTLKSNLEKKLLSYNGKSLFEIDLTNIATLLEKEKWIKSFEIQRSWPDSIEIKIKNYELVMLYWNEKNEVYPIFENNEILDRVEKKELPDRIYLFDKKIASNRELRSKAIEVIQRLPEKGPLRQSEIAEIGYDSKLGFWLQLIKNNILVKLGEEKIELKSERVSNVIDYLDSKQIDARVIDANLSQKVLVRLRKDP
ncbi:MAG: FtsQ-type POTRA domain-containing protein [Bdellovibrionales bacterium]|nr:FtsQ-type POTRA domain-containing protein [Bdellovibrionales bacterium]